MIPQFLVFLLLAGSVFFVKKTLGPEISASGAVGCKDSSSVCVNASRSLGEKSNTSKELRIK